MITAQHTEKGQAIVMLAIAIVALLGFVALAIDGGMAFSDRRQAQNASDASALAGAGAAAMMMETKHIYYNDWNCASSNVIAAQDAAKDAARTRAGSNGFTIDYDVSDRNGVTTRCEQGYNNGSWVEKYIEITTMISDTTPTSFAHLIFDGQLTNNVLAKTRVYPRSPLNFGHAIVALNQDQACSGNQGTVFGGSSQIGIVGGGIFSNGCMKCNSNGSNFGVDVTDGQNRSVVPPQNCGTNISPVPSTAPFGMPAGAGSIPPPDCSARGAYNYASDYKVTNGQDKTLPPGLHCFNGTPNALTMNGGTLTGIGVTLYAPNGVFSISGGEVTLIAPPVNPDPDPAIGKVLFYSGKTGGTGIDLTGNGNSIFEGTIYAPASDLKLTGNSSSAVFNTQLVGYNVNVSGNVDTYITYDDELSYKRPATLELFK